MKKLKKKRPIKSTWYNWLINYLPDHIRNTVSGFKNKTFKKVFLRKTHLRITARKLCMGVDGNQAN